MLASKPLRSQGFDVDSYEEAVEQCFERGWTDGLPVIPPFDWKVQEFVDACGRDPDEVLGVYKEGHRPVTVEKVAINAVMAGCLPPYLPVVLAIVEGLLEIPILHGINTTTSGACVAFIISGPIRQRLGLNSGANVLGHGSRPNATIGRAVRLTQINAMGISPTVLDRSTIGQPAKYTGYHIIENHEAVPALTPYHVERGFAPTESVATTFAVVGHKQMLCMNESDAEQLLESLSVQIAGIDVRSLEPWRVLILPPENAAIFARDGWTKAALKEALKERIARRQPATPDALAARPVSVRDAVAAGEVFEPDGDLHIVVSGGAAGGFPVFLWPFRGGIQSRPIRSPDA